MAVQVERDADGRVTEPLLCDRRVNPIREQVGRVGVAQIMESDLWQHLGLRPQPDEFMREAVRLKRGAILLRNDMGLIARSDADLEKLFALARAVLAEFVDDEGGQRDCASPARSSSPSIACHFSSVPCFARPKVACEQDRRNTSAERRFRRDAGHRGRRAALG